MTRAGSVCIGQHLVPAMFKFLRKCEKLEKRLHLKIGARKMSRPNTKRTSERKVTAKLTLNLPALPFYSNSTTSASCKLTPLRKWKNHNESMVLFVICFCKWLPTTPDVPTAWIFFSWWTEHVFIMHFFIRGSEFLTTQVAWNTLWDAGRGKPVASKLICIACKSNLMAHYKKD